MCPSALGCFSESLLSSRPPFLSAVYLHRKMSRRQSSGKGRYICFPTSLPVPSAPSFPASRQESARGSWIRSA
nr:MAG TPA: hypothetical protein [Bacteriophage sp.]